MYRCNSPLTCHASSQEAISIKDTYQTAYNLRWSAEQASSPQSRRHRTAACRSLKVGGGLENLPVILDDILRHICIFLILLRTCFFHGRAPYMLVLSRSEPQVPSLCVPLDRLQLC